MKGDFGVRLRTYLLLAVIALYAVSFPIAYYWTGGAQALDLSDPRVNIAIQVGNYSWLAKVTYTKDGQPIFGSMNLWSGKLFPIYLRNTASALLGLWLFTFLAPHLSGLKCPYCSSNFLYPSLCNIEEATVYSGGFDYRGDSLPPIVRQDIVCPRCGYRKITYAVPGSYRPGTMFRWVIGARSSTMGELDMYQHILDQWHSRPSHGQCRDYAEWKAFYDALKRSERVIHPVGGGKPA